MIILYTAIFGDSDTLKPAPVGADRCVCLTDRPLAANGWELMPAGMSGDPRRSAWLERALPFARFFDADVVVWADASFTVLDLPRLLRDAGESEIAGLRHPERSSCYEEGSALVEIGQSGAEDVYRQLLRYMAQGFSPKALSIAGLLVRRKTQAVHAFNAEWISEFLEYRGDNTQLSIDYAAWKAGLEIKHLEGVYTDNPYVLYDQEDHQARRRPYR